MLSGGGKSDFLVFVDQEKTSKNLGTFVSPPKKVGENIQLTYSNGDSCGVNKKFKTVITLICRPGKALFFDPLKLEVILYS